MKPSEEDHPDGPWNNDHYQYQQQRPISNGTPQTTSPLPITNSIGNVVSGAAAAGQQQTKQPPQAQGTTSSGAPAAKKNRFNEKTTLLNSDEEFQ